MEIIAYVTGHRDRVLAGSPLALYIEDQEQRKQSVSQLGKALLADVVQLKTGDYLLIRKS